MKLSKSAVNSYLKCPREFKYQYIDKIKNEPNKYMRFGTYIHEAAERVVDQIQVLRKCELDEDGMKEICLSCYDEFSEFDEEELDLHMDNLCNFMVETFVNNNYKVFSTEEYILDTDYNLSGLADLVLENENGDLVVIDYKTGKSGSIKKYRLELCYYKRLIEFKYPDKTVVTAGIFFTKDNGYRFVNFTEEQEKGAYITKEDYDSALELLGYIRKQVEEENFEPERQYICQYCSYKDLCKKDGGF